MDPRREQILRNIGIDVWRERPFAASPNIKGAGIERTGSHEMSAEGTGAKGTGAEGTSAEGTDLVEISPDQVTTSQGNDTLPIDPQIAPAPPASVETSQPRSNPQDGGQSVPIHFSYVKTYAGICLHDEDLTKVHQQFIRDLLSACNYLQTTDGNKQDRIEFAMGEFRWPILDSGGSPERALHAFFDKLDLGQDKHCVLVTDEVLANIEPMLSLEAKVIEMPAVSQIASDAGLKKKLWARLQQIHD